eukprot:768478-Hanusia_phi.AAC.12
MSLASRSFLPADNIRSLHPRSSQALRNSTSYLSSRDEDSLLFKFAILRCCILASPQLVSTCRSSLPPSRPSLLPAAARLRPGHDTGTVATDLTEMYTSDTRQRISDTSPRISDTSGLSCNARAYGRYGWQRARAEEVPSLCHPRTSACDIRCAMARERTESAWVSP